MCVYTAIYGKYDNLKPFPQQTIDCDFICFTDGTAKPMPGWRLIRSLRRKSDHPRMRAKYWKLLSHRVFPAGRLAPRYNMLNTLLLSLIHI